MKVIACLILCALVVGNEGTEPEKRQQHHAHTPRPTHMVNSADPLETWMANVGSSKPNVLFLIADDLRPKLGCYGETNMVTPNIDNLASKSLRFDQAFAQIAICSPSRTSFLTGRRPDTTRVFDLDTYFRTVAGNFTTLPQYFKRHGYYTQGVGKVFHPGAASGNTNDYPYSWSAKTFAGDQPIDNNMKMRSTVQPVNETETGKLIDTTVADFAINFLRQHSHHTDQPFFLAVGFRKPHLPWIFPEQFMSLYPKSNIHLAPYRNKPPTVPDIAWSDSNEIRRYHDIVALHTTPPDNIIPDDYQYTLRQGYSAATSFTDAQVGRVLEALTQNGFADNTIVTFLGDHGWQLGDNAEWCKQTNYDMALRIPMMLHIPTVTSTDHGFSFIDALAPDFDRTAQHQSSGHLYSTDELVEAVDLYPTLTELAGLGTPRTCPRDSLHVNTCTEGTSLVPLVRKVKNLPNGDNFTWKEAAFSAYHRSWNSNRGAIMGYTIRTKTHRYTEWVGYDRVHFQPNFTQVEAVELYDHTTDPNEINNLAENSHYSSTAHQLSRKLHGGWKQTLNHYLDSVH